MFAAGKTASVSGGYQISRSLRFNSADQSLLDRTPATATNRRTWTWSGWVKRSVIGSGSQSIFTAYWASTDAGYFNILFRSGDDLAIQTYNIDVRITTQVFRDPSAWYHIVVAVDTTQASNTDRFKLYVNGTQITTFSSTGTVAQNTDLAVNYNGVHYIGSLTSSAAVLNGYQTECYLIDGQALTPSSFGETNAQTGVWQPKAFVGTYGTNGFYVNFSDNSNTTAATLGKDYSGNGNNWTPNNFSVTAGVTNDSMVDVPTPYGIDTGVGGEVRGNYCTLSPLTLSNGTLSDGNLTWSPTGNNGSVWSTFAVNTGKWYFEMTKGTSGDAFISISQTPKFNGFQSDDNVVSVSLYMYYTQGSVSENRFVYNSTATAFPTGFGDDNNGTVYGVTLDFDAKEIIVYRNNDGTTKATFTMPAALYAAPLFVGYSVTTTWPSGQFFWNFGQRPFAYTAPSGFQALCTQNLPTPTIGATSATLATSYFAPVLYTGNSATSSAGTTARTITGLSFTPDLIWVKSRNNGGTWNDHSLTDSVRGANLSISANTTGAQVNVATGFSQGGVGIGASGGFTIVSGTAGGTTNLNDSSGTYVAWNWLANGSGSTNTAGTITSTVSASTTSGFSVVTYTGNSTSGATVGHGLGVAPVFVIVKSRNDTFDWIVWSASFATSSTTAFLNTTDAAGAYSVWSSTLPSSTVITLPSSSYVNGTSKTYVAYCFAAIAGYSAFGSYTGNGSTDGPFVYLGFRPAFILFKRYSGAGNDWRMTDSSSSTYNPDTTAFLYPNQAHSENFNANDDLDMLSNGFKIRATAQASNESGSTYIYMAFASNPFKYSLAR